MKRNNKYTVTKKAIKKKITTPSNTGAVKSAPTPGKSQLNKGASLPRPVADPKFSAKTPINPNSLVWDSLTTAQKQKMYIAAQKAANQRFRELEKRGMAEDSPIYISYKSKGYTLKSGNVGLSSAGYKDWNASKLKYEYMKAYNVLMAPTSSASKEKYQERMEEMLAHIGVDFDELMKAPKENREKLNEYWSLYNEAKRLGLWDKFGLGSYEAQEIVKEVMLNTPKLPKAGKGASLAVKVALNKVQEYEANSIGLNQDAYKQKRMVLDYNSKTMKSASDALLYQIGLHVWGSVPIENITTGEEKKDYLL